MTGVNDASALALFCDDVRMEANGKLILIGLYTSQIFMQPGDAIDRISVVVITKWPRDFSPVSVGLRAVVPGQPNIDYQSMALSDAIPTKPENPFSGFKLISLAQLRFPSLRIGDAVDMWVKIDDKEIPAGRIYVELATPMTPNITPQSPLVAG